MIWYVFMHACIHTYVHTYIRTYIHTYIHTYITCSRGTGSQSEWLTSGTPVSCVLAFNACKETYFNVCNMSYLKMRYTVSVPKWKVYRKRKPYFEGFHLHAPNYQSWKYILHTLMMTERMLFMKDFQTAPFQQLLVSIATTSNAVSTCLGLGINMKILNRQAQSRRIYMGPTWNSTPPYASEMDLGSIGCNFHNLCAGQTV